MSRSYAVNTRSTSQRARPAVSRGRGRAEVTPESPPQRNTVGRGRASGVSTRSRRTNGVGMWDDQPTVPQRSHNRGVLPTRGSRSEKVNEEVAGASGGAYNDGVLEGIEPTHSQAERRAEYRGSYTVIPPDERKRQSIAQQAESEARKYAKYKQDKKVDYVSYSGTVGGASVPERQVRTEQQRQQRRALPEARERADVHKRRARTEQTQQTELKRTGARRQAESNAEREEDRQARLDADRKKKNEAFLRRLEQNTQH